jgi:hypothetical protein
MVEAEQSNQISKPFLETCGVAVNGELRNKEDSQ